MQLFIRVPSVCSRSLVVFSYLGQILRLIALCLTELHKGKKYTRSTRKQSQSEQNESAITDHVNIKNHIIDWEEVTIIGWESDFSCFWINR